MDLLGLVIVLIIVGAALYLVETLLPIDQSIKVIIRVVVIVVVLLWVLRILLGDAVRWPQIGPG